MTLIQKLLALHSKGSLHPADQGGICTADGQRYPCSTVQLLNEHGLEHLTEGAADGS